MRFRTGGQTGVDRAVLDFCIEKQVEVIGWCPEQRKAEDGKIPDRYPLVELKDAGYDERTEANVLDSDATLILHLGEISGGTKFTVSCCAKFSKPSLLMDLREENLQAQVEELVQFIEDKEIKELNIAGPRASEESEAYEKTQFFFQSFWGALKKRK